MKKIVCFAGLPAVGKTTISRRYANRCGAQIVDIDKIKRRVVDPSQVTSTIDPPDVRWKCYLEAVDEVFGLFEAGALTVVVDEVFHLRLLRQRFEEICVRRGATVFWVEVRCSYAEAEKRLRVAARVGHILSTDEALKMNRTFSDIFEPFPVDQDNCVVFRNDFGNDLDCPVV